MLAALGLFPECLGWNIPKVDSAIAVATYTANANLEVHLSTSRLVAMDLFPGQLMYNILEAAMAMAKATAAIAIVIANM